MNKRKVLVLGNSHVWAVKRALRPGSDIEIYHVTKRDGRSSISPDEARERSKKLAADDILIWSFGNGHHQVYGMAGAPFEIAGIRELKDPRHPLIGASLLLHMFKQQHGETLERRRRNVQCEGVFHLASKPPIADSELIERRLHQKLEGRPVLPAYIRLQMWQLEMMALDEICRRIGSTYIGPPDEALTGDGFLKPELCGEDTVHANEQYGAMVLKQIEDVRSREQKPAHRLGRAGLIIR